MLCYAWMFSFNLGNKVDGGPTSRRTCFQHWRSRFRWKTNSQVFFDITGLLHNQFVGCNFLVTLLIVADYYLLLELTAKLDTPYWIIFCRSLVNRAVVFCGPIDLTPILIKVIDYEFFFKFNNWLYSSPIFAKPRSWCFTGGVNWKVFFGWDPKMNLRFYCL